LVLFIDEFVTLVLDLDQRAHATYLVKVPAGPPHGNPCATSTLSLVALGIASHSKEAIVGGAEAISHFARGPILTFLGSSVSVRFILDLLVKLDEHAASCVELAS